MRQGVSVIILCYQDGVSLPGLVAKTQEVLSDLDTPFEIVIVDDGSPDGSKDVIRGLLGQGSFVKAVFHETNQGVGAAFHSGVKNSLYDLVGYMDGDGQYDARDLKGMFMCLRQNPQTVMCSGVRVRRADGISRKVNSAVYNALVGVIYGLDVRDVNSGIKLFRRASLDQVLPIYASGPFFDAEVMIKLRAAGGIIEQLPVRHYPRLHGQARGGSSVSIKRAVREMVSPVFLSYVDRSFIARVCHRVLSWFTFSS